MSLTLYDVSIPVFIRGLKNLSFIISKSESHAYANSISHQTIMAVRLVPDMLPLTFQIQTCCNTAKNTLKRVAGLAVPSVDDSESTFEELQIRIKSTIMLLEKVEKTDMDGKEEKEVKFQIGRNGEETREFTGKSYLLEFALPNFYFHLCMAYALVRQQGVDVGKEDYLAGGTQ